MNKQKNMLLEMVALVAFIAMIGFLIWYTRSTAKGPNQTASGNTSTTLKDAKLEKGRLLFRSYCNSCHYINANGLGPALAGAKARWEYAGSYQGKTGDEWLKMWIRNWKDVIAAGYPYGVSMARSRETEMNMFINLTDDQIDLILNYVDCADTAAVAR